MSNRFEPRDVTGWITHVLRCCLQSAEPIENGCLKLYAAVGVGMVRGYMNRADADTPGFLKCGDKSFVRGRETVIGSNDEDRACRKFRREIRDVPGVGIRDGLFGEIERGADQRGKTFVGEAFRYRIDGTVAGGERDRLDFVYGHVSG